MKVFSTTFLFFLLSSSTTAFNTPFSKKEVVTKSTPVEKKNTFSFGVKKASSKPTENTVDIKIGENASNLLSGVPSPIGIAGIAMQTLAPLFALEAKVQAGVLTTAADIIGAPFRVYPDEIRKEIALKINSQKKPVLYTYGLSPFSVEAKNILEDYDVEIVELGPEWFLLGPEGSEKRLALAENSSNKQTSLPNLFFKGESLGGLSSGGRDNAGISGLQKSGDLAKVLPRKRK